MHSSSDTDIGEILDGFCFEIVAELMAMIVFSFYIEDLAVITFILETTESLFFFWPNLNIRSFDMSEQTGVTTGVLEEELDVIDHHPVFAR